MLAATKDVLDDSTNEYPQIVQEQIIGVLNARHAQVFQNGNLSSSAELYLTGAYLNPSASKGSCQIYSGTDKEPAYLNSDVFEADEGKEAPGGDPDDSYAGIHNKSTFKRVVNFLANVAHKEIHHGKKALLIQWKGKASIFKQTLVAEMKAYGRQQYPFNISMRNDTGVMAWWQALEGTKDAEILPVSLLAT